MLGQPSSKSSLGRMWTWPRGLKKLAHIVEEAEVDCVVEYLESLEWDCSSVLGKFCKQLRLWFFAGEVGI